MIKLTATVIEVAPQDGYAIIRFQLAGVENNATTGDCFNVAVDGVNLSQYEVGNTYQLAM